MLNAKNAAVVLVAILFALALNASAQWSPGGAMVYMGDLNLAASSLSSGKDVPSSSSSPVQAAMNNSSLSNSSLNNASINVNSTEDSNANGQNAVQSPADLGSGQIKPTETTSVAAAASPGKEVLDLSGYSRDRVNRNLAVYTNIMYPITGSRGTTTSTAGGGGCGGGCGS
ncbi:MAG: hypothetical protein PHY05_04805 [Methanothrix sp.]|nr:hypothetical protein [Methanothrix sp.]